MSADTREALAALVDACDVTKYVPYRVYHTALENARAALATQPAQPSRAQKMREAGFTARDTRLTCDECGAKFTQQFAPLHECAQPSAQGEAVEQEPAPANSLPDWDECALRVANSDFIAKRIAEGGYGAEPDSKLATQLHRFIYEYDDADPYRSAWFLHRLELLLNETLASAPAAPAQAVPLTDELEAALETLVNRCNADFVLAADDAVIAAEAALERLYRARVAHGIFPKETK